MRTLALLVFSVILAPLWAQSPPSDPKSEVIQLEQRWLASVDDPNKLESILADDFVHVLPTGIITKQEQLAYMRAHPSRPRAKRRFEKLDVRIVGEAAVATGAVIAVGENGVERRTYFTDVFASRSGRWEAISAQETPDQSPK